MRVAGLVLFTLIVSSSLVMAQAGRRQIRSGEGASMLNVLATREGDATGPLTMSQLAFYENGVEQTIKPPPRVLKKLFPPTAIRGGDLCLP